MQNLSLAAARYNLQRENLTILKQGVSDKAVFISQAERYQQFADGMVTTASGIILAIRTADCCPVLFYDDAHQVIGAAHAGWRGALRGILENTLNLMLNTALKQQTSAPHSAHACNNRLLNANQT